MRRIASGQALAASSRPSSPLVLQAQAQAAAARPKHSRSHASSVAEWQQMRLQQFARRMNIASAATGTLAEEATAPASAAPAPAADADITACDIRVGKILRCEKHPDADSLYVEQIDVGEPEPRTIVSGLVGFVPLEQMQERLVLVICNLKARNMRGVKSHGMVLCASNSAHDQVEPLAPPPTSRPGERVWFGEGNAEQPPAVEANRLQKKKIWEAVQPLLRTNAQGLATFKGLPCLTATGPVVAASLGILRRQAAGSVHRAHRVADLGWLRQGSNV
ncbi:tRNA-binding domain-containing protein [Haematococcus lacustris]|uniref:tRNA-binding domain-containing protein n=1 Tax=Haematococcus lacustris TaxID=44745 RepID=A0A6A0A7K0_HAELA|nr:tRNA-binding domain-containing protein [Haematococcus lacustris]